MPDAFSALLTEKDGQGQFLTRRVERTVEDLPEGDLLVAVSYSCLNYKDALSVTGHRGITRNFPHTPGVDAVGSVVESKSNDFQVGDKVIITGHDFGMNTDGGLSEYIRVPAGWAIKLPQGLTERVAMEIGSAGMTAGVSLFKLEMMGATPDQGPVLVTGATGGVGCLSVALLAAQGYHVVASSGKLEQSEQLKALGAAEVIDRRELEVPSEKALLKPRWSHAVDCVGGDPLVSVFKQIKPGGSVACSGLVASSKFNTTIFPFILRGVNLLGVDVVAISNEQKQEIWQRFASDWSLNLPDNFVTELTLAEVPKVLEKFLKGSVLGRYIVRVGANL